MNYSLQSSDLEFDRGILSSGFNISNSFNDTKDSNIAELTTTGDESILKEPFVKVSLGTVSLKCLLLFTFVFPR